LDDQKIVYIEKNLEDKIQEWIYAKCRETGDYPTKEEIIWY
jgi:hypothetical protein